MFGTRKGHVVDTSQNRKMLERVANDQSALLGKDKYDNIWHAKTLPTGKQVWVQMRKGVIRNGGLNDTPVEYNPVTGLAALTKSNQNVKTGNLTFFFILNFKKYMFVRRIKSNY